MIKLERSKILKQLGFLSNKSIPSKELDKAIDEEVEHSKSLIIPRKIIKMCELQTPDDSSVVIDKSFHISSKSLNLRLQKCIYVYLFVVTVGEPITKKMNEYIEKGEITRATIIDAIGSVAVETFADLVNSEIIELSSKANYETTKRFSPGYGDWSIADQKPFLKLIDAKKIQVDLNENFQMIPEKSISAIIGVKLMSENYSQ
jgi:hypothetical protein